MEKQESEPDAFKNALIRYLPGLSLLELLYGLAFQDDQIDAPRLTLHRVNRFLPTVDDIADHGGLVHTYFVVYVDRYRFVSRRALQRFKEIQRDVAPGLRNTRDKKLQQFLKVESKPEEKP